MTCTKKIYFDPLPYPIDPTSFSYVNTKHTYTYENKLCASNPEIVVVTIFLQSVDNYTRYKPNYRNLENNPHNGIMNSKSFHIEESLLAIS